MMTVIVTVFAAPGLTVSEKKTDTMLLRTPDQTTFAPPIIESAGQSYKQTAPVLTPGHFPRKRIPLAQNRPTDPPHAGMLQTVRPGVAWYDDRHA